MRRRLTEHAPDPHRVDLLGREALYPCALVDEPRLARQDPACRFASTIGGPAHVPPQRTLSAHRECTDLRVRPRVIRPRRVVLEEPGPRVEPRLDLCAHAFERELADVERAEYAALLEHDDDGEHGAAGRGARAGTDAGGSRARGVLSLDSLGA